MVAIVVVAAETGRRQLPPCHTPALPPFRGDPGRWLPAALELIPCPSTGRVSYGTVDSAGAVMGSLDPIDDPAGGYLGVYDSGVKASGAAGTSTFQVAIARSADLIHWARVRVLDPRGASMPSLRQIPGQAGYLLVYEKHLPGRVAHSLRLRYYPSRTALLSNEPGAQVDLPIRFSRYSNGTPAFLAIAWNGALARSTIALSFHYETSTPNGKPGADREALGVLTGFAHWRTVRDTAVDDALDRLGFAGNHGDRRAFAFGGRAWRVYEAQGRTGDFGTWRVLLYDAASRRFQPLALSTATVSHATTSFGNPTVQVLRDPGGHGMALVVTIFVFSTPRSAPAPGELVFYQPFAG